MPVHNRPRVSKLLKPEDDWTRVKDPREKKRIQNRVAQRTYRHRMKARLGELQARLEQHEGSHLSTPSGRAVTSEPSTEGSPQHALSSSPNPNDVHRALPRLDTNLLYQPIKVEPQEWSAQVAAGAQLEAQSPSHSLPPNYGLLSPPSHPDCANAMTPDLIACPPNLSAHYADLSTLPLLDDLSAIPQISGLHALAPTSTGTPSIASPQPNEAAPLADPSGGTEAVSFLTVPVAQLPTSSLVDASQGFGQSPPRAGQSQVLDTASQAATSGCCTWDEAGFQDEVLQMTESVIRAENSSARHDFLAKFAPLVDSCDANRLYSSHTLLQMKQTIQEDLPHSWAFAQAMAAERSAAWQAERSNIALASVLLTTFAGRIPNEKLLCLIGGCL